MLPRRVLLKIGEASALLIRDRKAPCGEASNEHGMLLSPLLWRVLLMVNEALLPGSIPAASCACEAE